MKVFRQIDCMEAKGLDLTCRTGIRIIPVNMNTRAPSLGGMFLRSVDYSRTLNALYKGESAAQEAIVSLTGFLDLLPMVLERNA